MTTRFFHFFCIIENTINACTCVLIFINSVRGREMIKGSNGARNKMIELYVNILLYI